MTILLDENNDSFNGYDHSLLVSNCGPITKIGQRSVGVGFGNVVKVITVGHERYDSAEELSGDATLAVAGRRRKPQGSGKRSYALS